MKVMRGHLSAALRMGDSLFARDEAAENVSNAAARRVGITLDSIHQENWTRERHADAAQRLDVLVAAQRAGGGLSPSALLTVAREYAWAGQSEQARSMLDRFDREVHDSVALRNQYSARLWTDGEVALAERRYPDALAKFRAADRMYDGKPHACPECTEVTVARAFDLGGMADSAIAAFERYLSRSASNRFAIDADYLAGSYKRLGELYEAKGDNQKAATYYGKFVELWKDADPELQPRVTEVRKRLARLNVQESKR
jgi:tetratricopeptide (TPR) repeat protein